MLRLGAALITPIRARFEEPKTPRPPIPFNASQDEGSPEDFVRDARIEAMRRATEELKTTEIIIERVMLLAEIHRILSEDTFTKDVFRELDGFLILMNILSAFNITPSQPSTLPSQPSSALHRVAPPQLAADDEDLSKAETLRLIFATLSEAIGGHRVNRDHFLQIVGYQTLSKTIETLLILHPNLAPQIIGYLIAFAFQDFTLSNLFIDLSSSVSDPSYNTINTKILTIEQRLIPLYNPEALLILLDLRPAVLKANRALSFATLRLIERTASLNHRNQALLNQLGIVGVLLGLCRQSDPALPPEELQVTHKLLKRILEMGASASDARSLFRDVVRPAEDSASGGKEKWALNLESLEILKVAMRSTSRWPELISFGTGALNSWGQTARLELRDAQSGGKPFPSASGLTYMCWIYVEKLPTQDSAELLLLDAHSSSPPRALINLRILPSGAFSLSTPSLADPIILSRPHSHSRTPSSMSAGATSGVPLRRWTHVALIHHSSRTLGVTSSGPSIRLFIDGILYAMHNTPLPRGSAPPITFFVGNSPANLHSGPPHSPTSPSTTPSSPSRTICADPLWYLASAHLINQALPNDVPRLIYTLGPRYAGNFQDSLGKFLTYQSGTSLNISIFQPPPPPPSMNQGHHRHTSSMSSLSMSFSAAANLQQQQQNHGSLLRAVKQGLGVREDDMPFALSPRGVVGTGGDGTVAQGIINTALETVSGGSNSGVANVKAEFAELVGNVDVMRLHSLDQAIWKLGGSAILLRLVELANTERELASTLSVLSDATRASWQISEDIERIHGYDTLNTLLRSKSDLISLEVYHILFEFLGVDFNHPENSTITNPIAYRAIALDFQLWSGPSVRASVQRLHLSHFQLILQQSKFRNFNAKSRFAKFGVVKRILFVLQQPSSASLNGRGGDGAGGYSDEMIPELVGNALKVVARSHFSTDATIKPILWYLVANLEAEEHPAMITSPGLSPLTQIPTLGRHACRERAEQVLEALVSILSASDGHLNKFKSAVPVSRVCVLLLGSRPTPTIAAQVLTIASMVLAKEPSFARKLELVSFWTTLKTVLPLAWDPSTHVAAFDVLLGRSTATPGSLNAADSSIVSCPQILPAILASLDKGLGLVAGSASELNPALLQPLTPSQTAAFSVSSIESSMEVLAEELIDIHSSNGSFRNLFMSKQITGMFINTCRSFVLRTATNSPLRVKTTRITEKLTHLVLMLALDNAVDGMQKEELMDILRMANDDPSVALPLPDPPTNANQRVSLVRTLTGSLRLDTEPTVGRRPSVSGNHGNASRQDIVTAERRKLKKMHQDHREYLRRIQRPTDWQDHLHAESGLWPARNTFQLWRLDDTEGPVRIRKKLEPESNVLSLKSNVRSHRGEDSYVSEDGRDSPTSQLPEAPPWAEDNDGKVVHSEQALGGDVNEDKHRRVRRELEPGDVIDAVQTVTRIVGVDASPGMLIIGKNHIYLLDGLVENEEGEIIEACDAPKDVLSVPGTLLEQDGIQRAQRWPIDHVASFSKRTFLFRDVGLEIYLKDSRSVLVIFPQKDARQKVIEKLRLDKARDLGESIISPVISRTALLSSVRAKFSTALLTRDEVSSAQRRWQARELSNFAYLSIINQASGRTPNDLTQYPVFPWVIADYDSEQLDFGKPATFRDLTMPMGALTEAKRIAAEVRYTNLEQVDETPFHYGTHFSSSMIVSHFLIRLSPFSHHFKVLQGGDWDLPDRLFSDVKRSWFSASEDSRGDVRELIPEFYTCPEFLENLSKLDFGALTSTGEKIDSVKLPPWAKQDPYLFIWLNRLALESDYVSEHLPSWIDLIWGDKQADPESMNVFHPLSYEGAIDLDLISDDLEKEATAGIIHNFGQTPRKLFNVPHPPRILDGVTTLPLGTPYGIPEHCHLLLQSSQPVKTITSSVASISTDSLTEKVLACPERFLYVPHTPHEHVQWGFSDQSLRLYIDRKLNQVAEAASVTCCDFSDPQTLVTGSLDGTVCIWRLTRGDASSPAPLQMVSVMRGHASAPRHIAVSKIWSLVVTGSDDGSVILWDLNRAQLVRTIPQEGPVVDCTIQDSTGDIAVCTRESLNVYTINGRLIASLSLRHERITCLAFHEREWCPIPVLATGSSDGSISLRTWNTDSTPSGERAKWEFISLHVLRMRQDERSLSSVTCLKFIGETLYSGDELGRVFMWSLPEN